MKKRFCEVIKRHVGIGLWGALLMLGASFEGKAAFESHHVPRAAEVRAPALPGFLRERRTLVIAGAAQLEAMRAALRGSPRLGREVERAEISACAFEDDDLALFPKLKFLKADHVSGLHKIRGVVHLRSLHVRACPWL